MLRGAADAKRLQTNQQRGWAHFRIPEVGHGKLILQSRNGLFARVSSLLRFLGICQLHVMLFAAVKALAFKALNGFISPTP